MTSASAAAYGRAATTRSCARFNRDVATISIVLVIWRVFSTDLMRRRSSLGFAIILTYSNGLELIYRLAELFRQVFVELLLVPNLGHQLGMPRRQKLMEVNLPLPNLVDINVI
jgi:hypothetical protein